MRGFARMDPEKVKLIASKGSKAAHALGKAHRFTSEEAKIAGRKGGLTHSREYMQMLGRKGGRTKRKA